MAGHVSFLFFLCAIARRIEPRWRAERSVAARPLWSPMPSDDDCDGGEPVQSLGTSYSTYSAAL
eukprot:3098632-Pyramimonas_sp.AAC.1